MTKDGLYWVAILLRCRLVDFFLRRFTSRDRDPIDDLIEQTYRRFEQRLVHASCNADDVRELVFHEARQVGKEWRSRCRTDVAIVAPNQVASRAPDLGTTVCERQGVLEFRRKLEHVLRALPPRAQEAFRLRQNGASIKVIAARLHVGTATVNRDLSRVDRAVRKTFVGVLLGSPIGSMLWLLIHRTILTPQQIYQTAIGARQTVALSDGSQLQLNTGTEVRARLGADSRNLDLVHGEAIFKVSSDPSRPFAVTAGGETLWALGTQFSVRLRDTGAVEVIVAEGRVGLNCALNKQSSSPVVHRTCTTELTDGVHAIIQSGQWKTENLSTRELQDRFSWTHGFLKFNGQPLPEVINELNRYIPVRIEIADPRLAELRLSGRVKIGPTEQVLAAILNTARARRDPSAKDPKVIRLISASP